MNHLLSLAEHFSEVEGTCLFYSGGSHKTAERSFLALSPLKKIVVFPKKALLIDLQQDHVQEMPITCPWSALKSLLTLPSRSSPFPEWVGYLAYEMGAFSDPDLKMPYFAPTIPLACFYQPSVCIKLDHQTGQIESNRADLLKNFKKKTSSFSPLVLTHEFDPQKYYAMIAEAKEEILKGNIYQVNLSHQCLFKSSSDPFAIFKKLNFSHPSPFSAFLNFKDFCLSSSSPERFLRKEKNNLEARPIKGTIQRGKDPCEDAKFLQQMQSSPKEKAELLMITDLMRNDLGKVSCTGTVNTEALYCVEEHPHIFHMHSIIRSQCLPKFHPIDLLKQLFPGGSISGCPKLKAQEIIYRLEGQPRGIYTGSIGFFFGNGNFDFNIAIRTCLIQNGCVDLRLGSGIVYDSDPEREWEETLHKGQAFLKS